MLHKTSVEPPGAGYRESPIARVAAHLRPQHAITVAVAASTTALGLAAGGQPELAFSIGSLVVWLAVLVGVAAGLFPRAEPPVAGIVAGACLAALAGLLAISLAYASDPGSGFKDVVRASGYLGLFVLLVASSRRGDAGAWLRGLAAGLTAVTLLALAGRIEPGLFGDAPLETARQLAERLPVAAGRLTWPVGYWNGLGAMMALATVLLAWFGARAETRAGRALAVALLPLPVLATYLAISRGGFAAAAIGVVVLLLATPGRAALAGSLAIGGAGGLGLILFSRPLTALRESPLDPAAQGQGTELLVIGLATVIVAGLARYALDAPLARLRVPRRAALAAAGAAAVACLGAALALGGDPLEAWEDFKAPPGAETSALPGQPDLSRGSSSGRWQFWGTALDAFAEEPLTGIGASDYEPYWHRHGPISFATRSAHSLFLESLAELGVAGGLASVGFFAVAGFAGWRRLGVLGGPPRGEVGVALGLLAAGAVAAAVEWTWNLPAAFGPVVVAAALLTGPATLPALAPRIAPPTAFIRTRRRFFVGVGMLLVAWAAICASGVVLLTERSLEHGRAANARGDFTDAVAEANEAIDLAPWSAEPYAFLAQTYQLAGDVPAAQEAAGEAIERAPEDWRLWILAGQLDVQANDIAGAKQSFKHVYELLPNYRRGASNEYFEQIVQGGPR